MGLIDNFAKSRGYEKVSENTVEKGAADMVTAGSWGEIFGGGAGGSPSFSSFNSQKEQLAAYVDWVYAATRYIAETCSTIDLRVFKNHTTKSKSALGQKLAFSSDSKRIRQEVDKLLNGKKTVIEKGLDGKLVTRAVAPLEELESHPVLDLLDCPNPYMTRTEFFEMTFLHLELAGEAFWAVNRATKNGPPTELWPLMPNLMSVVADKEKFILGYTYTVGGEQLPFAPEDIIHHKYSNPNDLRRGMSPVQAAARIIDTDTHMADHNRRIFYNGATVDAVLYTDNKLTDENWKRLNDQWKDQYSGSANSHKTAILENGLKYAPMALSNRDLDFLEGMNFNRDMILAIFGVPKSLLGMDESMSRANAEAAEYAFSKNKIRPKMLRLTSRITEDLAIQFDKKSDILVSFTDPVPDDKEFLLKEKTSSIGSSNQIGWRTINEVRAEDGDDPMEGGDEIFIQGTLVPVAYAAKEPVPEERPAVAEEDPKSPDNNDEAESGDSEDNDTGNDGTESNDTGDNSSAGSSGSTTSDSSTGGTGSTSPKAIKDMEESDPEEGGDLVPQVKPLPKEGEVKETSPKVKHPVDEDAPELCGCCEGIGVHTVTGFKCFRCEATGKEASVVPQYDEIPCMGREDSDKNDIDGGGDYYFLDSNDLQTEPAKAMFDTTSKVEEDRKKTAKSHAQLAAMHKDYEDIRNRVSNKYEGEFMKVAAKRFEEQKAEVLRNVKKNFKGLKATKSITKAEKKKTDNLFNKALSAAAWAAALTPIYRGAINTVGNAAFNYVSDASTIGTSAQFSGADPAIIDYMEARTTLVSVGIDDTTDRLLKTSLIEGISAGEDVATLSDRVEAIYGAAAGYRALRIARTEAIDSTTMGTISAWEQSGVVSGKQWATRGPNPCPHCLDMDGKTIPLSDNYFNKGDNFTVGEGESAQTMKLTYDDVKGPPIHPNCACTLIPVLAS